LRGNKTAVQKFIIFIFQLETAYMKQIITAGMAALTLAACSSGSDDTEPDTTKGLTVQEWGMVDGKQVHLYTITNAKGNTVTITNYGGIVTSWMAPDKAGNKASIVVGFDSLAPYLQKHPYFGALIGRYANRIGDATFILDGTTYQLAANNGKNHLHGGNKGYDKVVWDVKPVVDSVPSLTLTYHSPDGEEGYPGNLHIEVVYTFTDEDELLIEYSASTDKPTPVNLTNHAYFNLSGDLSTTILGHSLQVKAGAYTPVDTTLIPTGERRAVAGTPFDFTTVHTIGERIADVPGGYDHNYILAREGDGLEQVALLSDSVSGRKLEVYTTEPGMQFYSGNFLDGTIQVRGGHLLQKHGALCMETQHFPDSPNKPDFPSVVLKPGEKYHTVTKYKVTL